MNRESKHGSDHGRPGRPARRRVGCILHSDVCGRAAPSGHRGVRATMRTASRAEASPRSARPRASGGHGLRRTAQASALHARGRRSRRRTPVAARAGPHAPCSFRTSPHVVLRTHHLTHPPPILLHHRSRYSYHLIPHDIGGDISSLLHAVPQRCGLVRSVHPASSHHRQERGRQLTRRAAWMHGLTQPRALDEGIWHGQEC